MHNSSLIKFDKFLSLFWRFDVEQHSISLMAAFSRAAAKAQGVLISIFADGPH